VERPIELGALLAGAPEPTLAALARYGRATGEAFQLQDDILGMFGDSETVGKPVGSDLREGKFTFLILHSLRLATADDRELLRSSLGREDLTSEQAEAAREVIRRSGGLEAVQGMIAERLAGARHALAETSIPEAEQAFFLGFLDYMGAREQ
jgi:geranylgeranyl diphosphate synthase type I